MEPGQCRTTHSDPTSRRTAFRVGPLCSISLPHRGYVSNSPGPACTVPGGLARAPQAVSLAPEDYQTRLSDSVHPASPKCRGIQFTSVLSKDAPVLRAEVAVLLAKDAIEPVPPAEMKSGFYSPYFIVSKKDGGLRPILDLRVLNRALHKLPFRMLTQRRIFQCVRPFDWFAAIDLKDCLLPCLDPPSTQTVSPLCVRGASIPVQGPSLRAIPVASCLHQGRRSSPCTVKGSRHSYPQLPRRLAHPGPVSSTVVRTQGYGAQSPQPVGTSGQPGKEQTLPYSRGSLFSAWSWTRSTSEHVSQRSVLSQC